MKLTKKTVGNLLLIAFVLSFFVTPLGHYGKVLLNRLFSFSPDIVEKADRQQIADYNWKLKDEEWNFFSFEKSKGRVVLVNFWASWRLPSEAELSGIQKLYDGYKDRMDFYIVTNENRPPVEEFMEKQGFTFPVTYLIIGERAPFEIPEAPASYLLDKQGHIVIQKEGIADWNTSQVKELLNDLLQE